MGGDDPDRNYFRGMERENAGADKCGTGFVKRCSVIVHYDAGSDGILVWDHGDCGESGTCKKGCGKAASGDPVPFPQLPVENKANEQIAINFIANILGLGWAATPAGLKAMEALGELEEDRRLGRAFGPVRKRGVAGDEMCIFLILNISSLQLIPVNVIAYRSQYGSADPAGIIGGGILATMASTGAAVVYVLVMQRWGKRK